MKVKQARLTGPCGGVARAILLAKKAKATGKPLATNGPLVHNPDLLKRMGLDQCLDIDQIGSGGILLIRAHGATNETLLQAQKKGCEILDATCLRVASNRNIALELQNRRCQIVLVGKRKHPEVQTIVSCLEKVDVVENVNDLDGITFDPNRPVAVICQTTYSREIFWQTVNAIDDRGYKVEAYAITICDQVQRRIETALELGNDPEIDVVVVTGSKTSSNAKEIKAALKAAGIRVFLAKSPKSLKRQRFAEFQAVGVTSSLSSSMEDVARIVRWLERH